MRERVIGRVLVAGTRTAYILTGKRKTVRRFIKSNARHLRRRYGKRVTTTIEAL